MGNLDEPKESKSIKDKDFLLIVNARENLWLQKTISFEQVVVLAFGIFKDNASTSYTVTFSRGEGNKPEGSMVTGDVINVKDKMVFNVTATSKS